MLFEFKNSDGHAVRVESALHLADAIDGLDVKPDHSLVGRVFGALDDGTGGFVADAAKLRADIIELLNAPAAEAPPAPSPAQPQADPQPIDESAADAAS